MPDEPRVQELLAELLDRQATPEEVCGACLELLPVVRARGGKICRARAQLDRLLPIWPLGSPPTTMPPEELPLPQVPGYEVESVLGRGGMGVVPGPAPAPGPPRRPQDGAGRLLRRPA